MCESRMWRARREKTSKTTPTLYSTRDPYDLEINSDLRSYYSIRSTDSQKAALHDSHSVLHTKSSQSPRTPFVLEITSH